MANNQIVISRIQNRRGRRENLPQPLLPGEIALTADTDQAWMGNDPELAVPAVRVYKDKNIANAQTILDTSIVEAKFDGTFTAADFASLVTELVADNTITLSENDIKFDDTFLGEILSVTVDVAGSNYDPTDVVTAISSSGSGFVGEVGTTTAGPPGPIDTITVTNGGQNYTAAGTTFTVAGGTGATLSLVESDVHGYTVLIAARSTVDPNNTVANVGTAISNSTLASQFISSAAYSGTIDTGTGVLTVTTQTEAANLATLMNRVNGDTPGEVTGLATTELNIEITGGTNAGATVIPYELGYYIEGIVLAGNDRKSLFVFTQDVTFESGAASRAYCNTVATGANQDYDLQKNGVSFGTVSFAIGSNTGTVTIGASTSFTAGDRLEIFGPASPDGVLDEIAITLTGALSV
jgi:hypothetical protein